MYFILKFSNQLQVFSAPDGYDGRRNADSGGIAFDADAQLSQMIGSGFQGRIRTNCLFI
jgi:hypothetical protein